MVRTVTDLKQRLIDVSMRFFQNMGQTFPEEWASAELTMPQFRALLLLQAGSRRMTEIAENLGSSCPASTSMIDRMVEKKLVERSADPLDRRVVVCSLTAAGRAEADRLWKTSIMRMGHYADALAADELERVISAISLLSDAARTVQASDAAATRPAYDPSAEVR